ncbi:MAG: metallophosphoesterase family protein [Candidatus Omnitrophota bacterium]|nr:metallophosphoesterase family protein [Candidatus Omnitrophota bacterium]MDZ4242099.1 metallophosphoesterase family protein [Candidatus Omnitrophota bacterium]
MRYGIFSDIHGNLEALEAVIRCLKSQNIDQWLCVGDVVGYGADPAGCIRRVRDLDAFCVAGNHDWAVLGNIQLEYFNPLAREAVLWTRGHLSDEDLDFLQRLPGRYHNQDLIMVHSTLPEPEDFDYLSNVPKATAMFRHFREPVCFIGHTHVPDIVKSEDGTVSFERERTLALKAGARYIVNVGSVGQPRDGDPRAAYGIYDAALRTLSIQRVSYDVELAQEKILKSGLPPWLASRLAHGQ